MPQSAATYISTWGATRLALQEHTLFRGQAQVTPATHAVQSTLLRGPGVVSVEFMLRWVRTQQGPACDVIVHVCKHMCGLLTTKQSALHGLWASPQAPMQTCK